MRGTILGVCMVLGLTAGPAAAVDAGFKDWWVACDNARECAAFGFSEDAFEGRAFLKLARGAGAADPPTVEIMTELQAPAWTVRVDGKPIAGLAGLKRQDDRVRLTPVQSAALVSAIANGARLDVVGGGETSEVSLAGSSAALRWLDDQQKRAGTVTALVAKGAKPASAVPPAPPLPLVRAGAPVSQSGLPTRLPKPVQALVTECDDDIAERFEAEPIIARLSPGVVLYAPLCSAGAYNLIHTFILADEQGRGAHPANIRYANGEGPTSDLMNVDFDPATQTLSNFEKGRGIGDCGSANTWIWTGKSFEPTGQSLMGECRGVAADDWPIVFRSRER